MRKPPKHGIAGLVVGLVLSVAGVVQATDIPPTGERIKLFNGKNLEGFEIFVKDRPLNDDPTHVFTVEKGVLHVSGEIYGWAATRKEYGNYYLRAEYKWGDNTYAPRIGRNRDSGILYHMTGEHKIWPNSVEFQIMEGSTGDIILLPGAKFTVKGETKTTGHFDRFGKPFREPGTYARDPSGYRNPVNEIEKAHGEWNVVELVTDGNTIKYWVNGQLANEATGNLDHGKIMFQSEGAEIYFRNMEIRLRRKAKP